LYIIESTFMGRRFQTIRQ